MGEAARYAAVFGVAWGTYLATLSSGVLGGDAGELQFVPVILSLTHPTGYPLQVLMHHAWSYLPVSSVAWRLNALDATFAAMAVTIAYGFARTLSGSVLAGGLAAACLAFGELWWTQSVRGDKYTLNVLFLLAVLWLASRWLTMPTTGRAVALGVMFGLSLAHHRSMLLVVPSLGLLVVSARWRPRRALNVALPCVAMLLPLLLYAYVPWAASRGLPPGSWPVGTVTEFTEYLMDRGYSSAIRPDAALQGRLLDEGLVLWRNMGPVGVALGLVGAVASLIRAWKIGVFLLVAFIPQAVLGASYLLESNYAIPRHWVFYLPGFAIWAVWAGLGGAVLASRLRSRWVIAGALVVVVAAQVATAWRHGLVAVVRAEYGAVTLDTYRQDLQNSRAARRFGELALASVGDRATIVSDWEQATVLWYLQLVEGVRPDVTIRYPIERLDEELRRARGDGHELYITRHVPGAESLSVIASNGPLARVWPEPAVGVPAAAVIALDRIDGVPTVVEAGSVLPITLTWRAGAARPNLSVSVRVVDQGGSVVAQQDQQHPALGMSPTSRWAPGHVVGDYYEIPVGARLTPGPYRVVAVVYDQAPGSAGQPIEFRLGQMQVIRPGDWPRSLLAQLPVGG